MRLHQIMYCSRRTLTNPVTASGMDELLTLAVRNNASRQLTGCLAYGETWFVQILEGPEAEVQRTLDAIRKDTRHTDVTVILERDIHARSFPDWHMARVESGPHSPAYLALSGLDGDMDPARLKPSQIIMLLMDAADSNRMRPKN